MKAFSLGQIIKHIEDGNIIVRKTNLAENIDNVCKFYLNGVEVPLFGAYEDEKGFLHMTSNIIPLIHIVNETGGESKLIKQRLLTRNINVVISNDEEYLKLFL